MLSIIQLSDNKNNLPVGNVVGIPAIMDEDCIHTNVVLGAILLHEVVLAQSHSVGCSWGPGNESHSN